MIDRNEASGAARGRRRRRGLGALAACLAVAGLALADPLPFRVYDGLEYYDFRLPPASPQPSE